MSALVAFSIGNLEKNSATRPRGGVAQLTAAADAAAGQCPRAQARSLATWLGGGPNSAATRGSRVTGLRLTRIA
jgi:hypothetical protein